MSNTNNPLVIFTPSGKKGYFPIGTKILDCARKLGVDLDSVCGGRGICSKCQVTPSYGDYAKHGVTVKQTALSHWNSVEEKYHEKRGLTQGRRLGCQAQVNSDVIIDVPAESQVHKQVVRKRAEVLDITMNPSTKLFYVEVAEPDMQDPSGDLERLIMALKQEWNLPDLCMDISLLKDLQKTLRKGKWGITCAVNLGDRYISPHITKIWPGFYEGHIFGLAVDIGSTTIAAHLCDLKTGEVISSSGLMNPQIRFGEDLMSRVSYSMMNEDGSDEMTKSVRIGLNELFLKICDEGNITRDLILEAVFVCNPVMHHLLLGIDPFELGQAPFALASSNSQSFKAREIGIDLSSETRVYILPCIAGHVGADAAAVALSEQPGQSDKLRLVVDVGTNAEILLGNKEKVLACSSPTGPAFEGAQISSGQRAAPGAIESVTIDPKTKNPRFQIIGCDSWSDDAKFHEKIKNIGITGICGSGIIEMVAEMRLAGILDASGLIGSEEQTGTDRCFKDGRTNSYLVWDDTVNGGTRITVTNRDIREIQMAKAALYSGAKLLMDKFNTDKVDKIILAGAFGAHISPKHAMILGMIPDCNLNQVSSAGNAAGTGARIALLNKDARTSIEEAVLNIHKIETAIEPKFQEHFVNASNIPNAVEPFPILNSIVRLPINNFNESKSSEKSGKRRRRKKEIK